MVMKRLKEFGPLELGKKCCAVYVMASESHPEFRVGHYSTSGLARMRQVRGGTGEVWTIVCGVEFKSKKRAAAVEAIAHHLLEKKICLIRAASGRRIEVFACGESACKQAIQKAANFLGQLNFAR